MTRTATASLMQHRKDIAMDVIVVYKRIMKAARKGKGLRLSAEDVWAISRDGAVSQAIDTDDAEDENERLHSERTQ